MRHRPSVALTVRKEFGAGIGLALCGDMDIDEWFDRQYYYPYFFGTGITSHADVFVERRMDREAYVGICEDIKIGISLIFYLQNTVEYLKEKQLSKNSEFIRGGEQENSDADGEYHKSKVKAY